MITTGRRIIEEVVEFCYLGSVLVCEAGLGLNKYLCFR